MHAHMLDASVVQMRQLVESMLDSSQVSLSGQVL